MRYAIIDQITPGQSLVNVLSVVDTDGSPPATKDGQGVMCDPPDDVAEGWVFAEGAFYATPPQPTPPRPPIISDRQFYQQLAVLGMITQAEAIAAVGTGAIPSEMKGALSALPADEQFGATMKLTGATTFERDDPLVAVFAAAQTPPMTSDQLDALWQAADLL